MDRALSCANDGYRLPRVSCSDSARTGGRTGQSCDRSGRAQRSSRSRLSLLSAILDERRTCDNARLCAFRRLHRAKENVMTNFSRRGAAALAVVLLAAPVTGAQTTNASSDEARTVV